MKTSNLKTFWGQTNVTDGNDAEPDLSLSDAEGDIGDDVLDPYQVIHDNIIININDRVLVSYKDKRFPGEVTNITGSEFEVNVIHKSGNLWKWSKKEDKILYKWEKIVQRINPPAVAVTWGQFSFNKFILYCNLGYFSFRNLKVCIVLSSLLIFHLKTFCKGP